MELVGKNVKSKKITKRLKRILLRNKVPPVPSKKRDYPNEKTLKYRDIYKIAKELGAKSRYRVREDIILIANDPILSVNWHFYKKILKQAGKGRLIDRYRLEDRIHDIENLSELSECLFKNGVEDYQYIVGIQTLYGWRKYDNYDAVRQKIKDWLCNDFKPNYKGSYQMFLDKFRANVKDILRWQTKKIPMEQTAEEFVSNISNTSTAGSAYDPGGKRMTVEMFNETIPVANNKFAKSCALSVKEKLKRLFKKEGHKSNVSIKTEFYPKVRLIVSSDFNTFLKMKFVDSWLSTWMHGNPISTLYQTKRQTLNMWRKFADNSQGEWNIPIDQSAFDHKVTKEMVLIMCEEQTELIRDNATNNDELLRVSGAIYESLLDGKITYKDPTGKVRKYKYESGIESGWYWTAHFDTLANVAEFKTACELCAEYGIDVETTLFNAQGDDDLVRVKTLAQAASIAAAYRAMGFDVHPRKTFFSQKHNEYLRKFSKDNEINGYPARMVNNILWVYPGEMKNYMETEKLHNTTSVWIKFGERLHMQGEIIRRYIVEDLSHQRISAEVISGYLTTDRVLGGAQLIKNEGVQTLINMTKSRLLGKVSIDDAGYSDFISKFGKYQTREMKQWVLSVVGFPKTYKKVELQTQQEILITKTKKIEPLHFNIVASMHKPTTKRNEGWPDSVILGQSRELMHEVFPFLDSFVSRGHAPKSWIYSYLTGRLKITTPLVKNCSEEFSSLIFEDYKASIINAMYLKRTSSDDKWLRLQQYACNSFSNEIHSRIKNLPMMY